MPEILLVDGRIRLGPLGPVRRLEAIVREFRKARVIITFVELPVRAGLPPKFTARLPHVLPKSWSPLLLTPSTSTSCTVNYGGSAVPLGARAVAAQSQKRAVSQKRVASVCRRALL